MLHIKKVAIIVSTVVEVHYILNVVVIKVDISPKILKENDLIVYD